MVVGGLSALYFLLGWLGVGGLWLMMGLWSTVFCMSLLLAAVGRGMPSKYGSYVTA